MKDFSEWLQSRWKAIGYTSCPEHLRKAQKTGDPKDLPVAIWPEWLAYCREHNHAERERRLADPDLNAEVWEDHLERLRKFRRSRWAGDMYFVGERGGYYRIGRTGRREYL